MGLLDDLRQQASDQEAEEQQANSRKQNSEEIYRTVIQPKLNELYTQLSELAKHLNYLKKDIHGAYIINAENQGIKLLQQDYNAHIDSTTDTKQVAFTFKCTYPKEVEFAINDPKRVSSNVQFLQKSQLQYRVIERKNEKNQLQGAKFIVKPSVYAKFTFEADIENASIKLTYSNFDQFGSTIRIIKPEDINDDFFDQLGHFIIRENDDFLKENVDDDVREQIRIRIEQEKRERLEELKAAEKLREEEEARKAEEGRFGFLKKKKLFQKE